MTFKKTVTISIAFHLCFFSAALLLSAGLLKGRGDIPEAATFFVSLETMVNKSVNMPAINEKAAKSQQARVAKPTPAPAVKKEASSVIETVATQKQEAEASEPVPEKTLDVIEKQDIAEPVNEITRQLVMEEDNSVPTPGVAVQDSEASKEITEIFQAAYHQQRTDEQGEPTDRHETGFTPEVIKLITTAIEKVKTYPVIARKRGIEGTVHVSFLVQKDGNPQKIEIMKSSGFNILDRATVRVVKKAAPYPFIEKRIEVPVAYRLKSH